MKPMLADKTDGKKLTFPVLASPKLDGVRALVIDGVVYSRNLKPIPNAFVQELFGQPKFNGLDGELIVGEPTSPDCFRVTTSGVMSSGLTKEEKLQGHNNISTKIAKLDVYLHVFDFFGNRAAGLDGERPFHKRLALAAKAARGKRVKMVDHVIIENAEALAIYEAECLKAGFEGVMVRAPSGPYKQGRSTEREGWLLKLKRFEDSEAVILDTVEQMHNGNEATKDELGRTKRSSHKAGKTGKGTLGALQVKDVKTGVEFDIGTGFDDATRAALWGRRNSLKGLIVRYKFFPTGSKEKPRFPVFQGFRSELDL